MLKHQVQHSCLYVKFRLYQVSGHYILMPLVSSRLDYSNSRNCLQSVQNTLCCVIHLSSQHASITRLAEQSQLPQLPISQYNCRLVYQSITLFVDITHVFQNVLTLSLVDCVHLTVVSTVCLMYLVTNKLVLVFSVKKAFGENQTVILVCILCLHCTVSLYSVIQFFICPQIVTVKGFFCIQFFNFMFLLYLKGCNSNCLDNICDMKTGDCLDCPRGLYGTHCQHSTYSNYLQCYVYTSLNIECYVTFHGPFKQNFKSVELCLHRWSNQSDSNS